MEEDLKPLLKLLILWIHVLCTSTITLCTLL